MKPLLIILATMLCSCSTTELAQTQAILDAANAALNIYKEQPTK
jgi:uncharacterized lipoprotein YmbA